MLPKSRGEKHSWLCWKNSVTSYNNHPVTKYTLRLFPAMHTNLKVITKFPRKDQIKLLSEGVQYLHFLHISSLFCVNMQSCDLGTLHFFSAQSQMFRVNLWPGKQCHLKGARPGWGFEIWDWDLKSVLRKVIWFPTRSLDETVPRSRKPVTWRFYLKQLSNYTSH